MIEVFLKYQIYSFAKQTSIIRQLKKCLILWVFALFQKPCDCSISTKITGDLSMIKKFIKNHRADRSIRKNFTPTTGTRKLFFKLSWTLYFSTEIMTNIPYNHQVDCQNSPCSFLHCSVGSVKQYAYLFYEKYFSNMIAMIALMIY